MNRFEKAPRETLDRLTIYEEDVRRGQNTFRDLGQTAPSVGFEKGEELGRFLTKKDVLDLGAGYCGLAIDARVLGFSSRIRSLSPAAANTDFEKKRWQAIVTRNYHRRHPLRLIENAIDEVNPQIFPHFAHDLPFPNFFFDIVIDNWAVSLYADNTTADFYEAALYETLRVLRPGGVYLIGDPELYRGWIQETIERVCVYHHARLQPCNHYQSGIQTGWRITV